jgi:hypothetical protein
MNAAKPDAKDINPVLDLLLEKANKKGHLTLGDLEEIIPLSGSSTEVRYGSDRPPLESLKR